MGKYFTEDELELLDLIDYFKKKTIRLEIQGKRLQDHDEFIYRLEHMKNVVIQNKVYVNEFLNPQINEISLECPNCSQFTHIQQTGVAEKNSKGLLCNEYYCAGCKKSFLHYFPNNDRDQLKWYKEIILQFERISNDKRFSAFTVEFKDRVTDMRKSYNRMKNAIKAEKNIVIGLEQANATVRKIISEYRNMLLVEKMKEHLWSGEIGEC